jgi:hypothetical protein
MLFLKLFVAAYFLSSFSAFLMAKSAIEDKAVRRTFALLAMAMPVILLYAAIVSLFSSRKATPYHEGMGAAEDKIEAERVRIFGGDPICPSFNDRWKLAYEAYLRKLVQRAAKTSEKIAHFGDPFHVHRAWRA